MGKFNVLSMLMSLKEYEQIKKSKNSVRLYRSEGRDEYVRIEEVSYFILEDGVVWAFIKGRSRRTYENFETLKNTLSNLFVLYSRHSLMAKTYIESLSATPLVSLLQVNTETPEKVTFEQVEIKDELGNIQCIPVEDVYYFTIEQDVIYVHFEGGSGVMKENFKVLTLFLEEKFIRIKYNNLVAKKEAKSITKTPIGRWLLSLNSTSKQLEVSMAYRKSIRRLLGEK